MGGGACVGLDLRPYQIDLHAQAKAHLADGIASILIQSPTGSGKTVLIAHMLKNAKDRGYRAWFIVHRRELVKQSVATLTEAAGISVGIVAAGAAPARSEAIQICLVNTLANRLHLMPGPNLIVFDEAHHLAAGSWAKIQAAFPDAVCVGLSATPQRLDGRGLGAHFKRLVVGPSVESLIDQGYLSPYRLYAPNGADLSSVHTVAGDYNKKELDSAMQQSPVVGDALMHYQKYATGKRAVIFMWSIESSKEIVLRFNTAGIPAAHIDGSTPAEERDRIVAAFRHGRILMLSNVDIVSEGFDLPSIEAAFLLRPTQSLSLYLQQVGRAMRPFPGKKEALIFDHANNCKLHGLPDDDREWSLEGRKRRTRDDACPVKQCPKCYAVNSAAVTSCRYCGFQWLEKPRDIQQSDGELSEVDIVAQRAARKAEEAACATFEALVSLGERRGYSNAEKWARFRNPHLFYRAARLKRKPESAAVGKGRSL